MSFSISDEVWERMNEHPEINWSEAARRSIEENLRELEALEEFNSDSDLTEEDAVRLGSELNADLAEHCRDA
jgi:hypothetical protein